MNELANQEVLYADEDEDDSDIEESCIKEDSDEDVHVKNSIMTNGGYHNNATTVYGELTDGNYFVFFTEMDLIEVYDVPVEDMINSLYDSESDEDNIYNEFHDKHFVRKISDGPLSSEITDIYFNETADKDIRQ